MESEKFEDIIDSLLILKTAFHYQYSINGHLQFRFSNAAFKG